MKRNTIGLVAGILISLCAPLVSLAFLDTLDVGAIETRHGGTTYSSRSGQTFLGSDYGTALEIQLLPHGTMSDDLVFGIYETSGGFPTGSALGTVGVPFSALGTSCEVVPITLPDLTLDPATTYALTISRVGSLDNTNFWGICGGTDNYSGGDNLYYDGAWYTDSVDHAMKMTSSNPEPEPLAPDLSISTSTAPLWLSAISQFVFFSTLFFLLGIATSIWILVRFFK